MYPLNVVVVGCEGDLLHEIRGELALLEARIEAEFPELTAAVARLHSTIDWAGDEARRPGRDRMFIVHLKAVTDLRGLHWLRQTFPDQSIVALADGAGDPAALAPVLREGASHAFPLPLAGGVLRSALEEIARPHAPEAGAPKVLAVAGAAGGCGATTLAVNLASELADRDQGTCVLLELAPRLGKLADYLDLKPQVTVADLLQDSDRLDGYRIERALMTVSDGLAVLPGPRNMIGPHPARAKEMLKVIDLARRYAEVVVVDVPCTYDEPYFAVLAAADRVILVGEQRVPTLRALKLVSKAVRELAPGRSPTPVINRYDPRLEGFGLPELGRALGAASIYTIADDSRGVADAINRGVPLRRRSPHSPALADIAALAKALFAFDGPKTDWQTTGSGVISAGSGVRRLIHAFGLS